MDPCGARFLETPHSELSECIVDIQSTGMQIRTSNGKLVWIAWEECNSLEKAGRLWRIAGTRENIPFFVLLDQESCFVSAREYWSRICPEAAKRTMEPETKLLLFRVSIFATIGIAIVALLYFLFIHIYWIVPVEFDRKLGNLLHSASFASQGDCPDSVLQNFTRKAQIALRLPTDQFEHEIQIVPDETVNAFAIPGGRIYVHRGILEKSASPDEILGVIAHEMAHSELRHGTRQIWQNMALGLILSMTFDPGAIMEIANQLAGMKYSREFEAEADRQAIQRMLQAGLSPRALETLLRRISPEGINSNLSILSTHPLGEDRFKLFENAKLPKDVAVDTLFLQERGHWTELRNPKCK